MKEGDERDLPFFFQKPADAVVGSGERVPYPPMTDDYQFEGELVVAIGEDGANLVEVDALGHIFGYAAGLDMTRRDRQREAFKEGRPWEVGKAFDESAPCGSIRPIGETADIGSGALTVTVNGATQQQSDLDLMIWKVPEIVARLSQSYTLRKGDLIYTGTPAGVAPVRPGDHIVVSITGLPDLEVEVR